jgi:kynurenine formamidase
MSALQFVDLSVPIREPVEGELAGELAPALAARIEYQDHQGSLEAITRILGCTPEDLPDGQGWGNETVTLSTHSGTHVDAPWHYFPTCGGQPAKTIDQLALEHFFGAGVVLDLRQFEPGERVPAEAVQAAVEATGQPLAAGEIVLLRYDADKTFGTAAYWTEYPGLTADATRWIIEQGVKVIGTDAVGFDRDFGSIAADFARDGDAGKLWEAHRVGMDLEYFQIEKLANLDQLPTRGFTVACFPVNIARASASWVRAVAIVGL